MKAIVTAAALIVSALSVPALADPVATATPTAATSTTADSPERPAPGARKRGPNTVYCFQDTITGSHIPTRECRTRQQWEQQGVTIPERYR